MAQTRLVAAGLVVAALATIFGRTSGFLATPLNTTDPDIVNILCPEQTTGVTRDHKWITREAVRRNIRQFFLDNPPPSKPDYNVPLKASLTELFHSYYGENASPARFITAVNTIAASNVKGDSALQLKYDPELQADAEAFDGLHNGMSQRYPQIMTSILIDESFQTARWLIGLSLHSLQKFYSHSTWIEQGNTGIAEDLGIPGFTGFDSVAALDEDVCTPCTDAYGGCTGNVIMGAGLTSGYYTYADEAADGILVSKPSTGGKCSHGGVLDDSAANPAEGGINKDTASPCFSPHYQLHEQAAELAVQATDHYLSVILDAVGAEKYRRLFDLYFGSALSITIDTTKSMDQDIAAVKEQVKEIVANSPAELYVLVPFNDPLIGPVTKTSDPDVFVAAVEALHADGGDDFPELYWGGLQLALANTPNFGDIFCFTDATAKDGDLMEGNIALAVQRQIKVTTVYSENGIKGDVITDIEDYQRLADVTGGLFIPSDKFSVAAITPILGEGVQSQDVDVEVLKEITGVHNVEIPIDDSIIDFELRITGTLKHCNIKDTTGKTFHIMQETELAADPDVEIVVYTTSFRAIRWKNLHYGTWRLHVDSDDTYDITIMGNSTLSWLGGFSILNPSPPHPHYMAVEGYPLTNTIYYLDVLLIGYLESHVDDVDHVDYVTASGETLRSISYNGEIDDEFYIRSEPLPEQPFYVKLYGHVHSGNVFCRLLPVMITPVQASVEVLATAADLSALPGHTTSGDFLITNYGLESDFDVNAADSEGYLTFLTPHRVHIATNESATVTASFVVPPIATPGTVSIVTVTAQSLKQTQSVNSAVTTFLVLSEDDRSSPLCVMDTEPDCTGYIFNGVCDQKNWTAAATLQDAGTGLSNAYVKPDGYTTDIAGFTPGTTGMVSVTHMSSCCYPQAEIIGVDGVGNVGKCTIDMGVLGGYIINFEAIEAGTTWVYLKWSITPTIYQIHKYSLLTNDDLRTEFPCHDETCYHNATYLDPCALQNFQLTPHFYISDIDRAGEPSFTDASTLDIEPSPPENGVVVDTTESSATISWDVRGTECVSQFKVCYRTFGVDPTKICMNSQETTFLMENLEACAAYEVEVTTIGISGRPSEPLVFYINTDESLPGAPRNVEAIMSTDTMVTITWDDPEDHAMCIDQYTVTYKKVAVNTTIEEEETVIIVKGQGAGVSLLADHTMTISPLEPCTGYIFKVAAVSRSGLFGPFAQRQTTTLEGDPGPVYSMDLNAVSTDSIHVQWEAPTACVDHFLVCYFDPEEVGETCQDVVDTQVTLDELFPCTEYFISVTVVTPSGILSNKTWQDSRTLELAPGMPSNVAIVDITSHSIDIHFEASPENPQCTVEFDFEVIDKTSSLLMDSGIDTRLENIFQNLEACTLYQANVRAVSFSGLQSPWASVEDTTLEDMPSAPRNFIATSVTSSVVDFIWFRPETNSRCAKEYLLDWGTGSKTVSPSSEGDTLPFEIMISITGLTPCTEYNFILSALTPLGAGGETTSLIVETTC